jgi:hypothetical protein
MLELVGGMYRVQHNAAAASSVELPLAPESAFPADSISGSPTARCTSRRRIRIRIGPHRGGLRDVVVRVDGRRVRVTRGRRPTAVIDLRKSARRTVTVRISGRTARGRRYRETRRYRTCTRR